MWRGWFCSFSPMVRKGSMNFAKLVVNVITLLRHNDSSKGTDVDNTSSAARNLRATRTKWFENIKCIHLLPLTEDIKLCVRNLKIQRISNSNDKMTYWLQCERSADSSKFIQGHFPGLKIYIAKNNCGKWVKILTLSYYFKMQ